MPKLILKCACEIDGVEHKPGDKIEVDEDNAARMLRKGWVEAPKKSAPKKKAKAEAAE
jgi:hypothetical protein|tara:strand:- start:321 stop:494 length:174 start_codon:yes stop_codon:yes gene_type:complete